MSLLLVTSKYLRSLLLELCLHVVSCPTQKFFPERFPYQKNLCSKRFSQTVTLNISFPECFPKGTIYSFTVFY